MSQESPKISVIIPTYERLDETLSAIASVVDQSYPNLEVIVVDDGSSSSVFDNLAQRIPEGLKLIQIPHSGHPGRARNAGLSVAEGEWIAFLDSDDLWNQDKLEVQMRFAMSQGVAAVSCEMSTENEAVTGKKNLRDYEKIQLHSLLKANKITNSSVLIKKSLLVEIGGIPSDYNVRGVEDYAAWLRVVTNYEWLHLNQSLGTYFETNPSSIRRESLPNHFQHFYAIIDYLGWLHRQGRRLLIVRLLMRILLTTIAVSKK